MAATTIEVEVSSQFPAEKLFKVFSDFDNLAPKVNPQVFKSIETVEGHGDVGTIKKFTFGEAVPFTTGKYKVDAIDASNHSFSTSFIEGDNLFGILDSVNHHAKVVPSPTGGSVFKLTVIYNCKGDEKPSAEILAKEKEIYETTYKAIEAYAAAHPETY